MTRSRLFLSICACAAVTALPAVATADDAADLERATTSYDAGRYAEGVERFQAMNLDAPRSSNDPQGISIVERARTYYAACLIALGRNDDANEQIAKILRKNPLYKPDPVVFPSKVIDRFVDVRNKLSEELERASRVRMEAEKAAWDKADRERREYITSLQKLAAEEVVVSRHSRWIAALPFGAGQFQNGQEGLGYTLLISQALLAGTSIAAGVIHMQLVADYAASPRGDVDQENLQSRLNSAQTTSILAAAGLGLVALSGILQAELAFVPEVREVRVRALPKPPPSLAPSIVPAASGLTVGVVGRF